MKKYTKTFLLISGILLLQISAISAFANELWVKPSETETAYGNWGVTSTGVAYFSFAVPNDMTSFTSAKIVIIPTKALNLPYNLTITVGSAGASYTNGSASYSSSYNVPAAGVKELQEIDVSSILPATLNPGQDHVSIYFASKSSDQTYIRVMGLRFVYSGAIVANGTNTAAGVSALPSNTTGGANTAGGYEALFSNTTGGGNTASGYEALYSNTTGGANTASGYQALYFNTIGNNNTASGLQALYTNTTGGANTAGGVGALYSNTTGNNNTAGGVGALYRNTIGVANTASGFDALFSNTIGYSNTASGVEALYSNTTGYDNTADGLGALYWNTTGYFNTASGEAALYSNTTGYDNAAIGVEALYSNTTGTYNTASGLGALYSNTTGYNNTATGEGALSSNTTGYNNTALGAGAGYIATEFTGSNNIYIGSGVQAASPTESNTIRIGSGQSETFIAGINGATVTGSPVYVDPNTGQLGTLTSSRRYKEDVEDMGDASSGLMKLRPVSFHYKPEYAKGPRQLQYGLIAEEVAEVYPDLVQYDPKTGQPQTVYYHLINAMLLNEVQKQEKELSALRAEVSALKGQNKELETLKEQVRELSARMEQNKESSGRFSKLETQLDR
ncbi:MAG: tail fiber domain-containing protein [Syntrophobacteraceae bacterium]